MKISCFILLFGLYAVSCNTSKDKSQIVTMNAKDITVGPIVHDSLSSDQLEKIKKIQQTFSEVYRTSLEETITNFKRDQNPDKEIQIWLNMAGAYEKYTDKYSSADSAKKSEAFTLLLLRSMMPDEDAIKEAKLKYLSPQETNYILHYYTSTPVPVTIKND